MTEPLTDQPEAREALLARLSEAALDAVQPEIDRLRANLTKVFHQLKAAERESEQRLGELLFWEFEYREAMDNYKGEAAHAKSLRAAAPQISVEDLAQLIHAADVHVNDGHYPAWADLSDTPGLGKDDVRKAARWLLERLSVTSRTAAPACACGAEPVHQNGCEDEQ